MSTASPGTTVEVTLSSADGAVVIAVEDQGIGVSAEDGKLLWKMPFTTQY